MTVKKLSNWATTLLITCALVLIAISTLAWYQTDFMPLYVFSLPTLSVLMLVFAFAPKFLRSLSIYKLPTDEHKEFEEFFIEQAKKGNLENMKFLVSLGVELDTYEEIGSQALVEILSARWTSDLSTTALEHAYISAIDRFEAVDFLLRNGAEINPDSPLIRRSPLMEAICNLHDCWSGKSEDGIRMLKKLIDVGAYVWEVRGSYPIETSLTVCMEAGTLGAMQLLIDNGAKDVLDLPVGKHGETVMMRAARDGRKEMVEFFLANGADPAALNGEEQRRRLTAYDVAVSESQYEIAEILKQAMEESPEEVKK